MNSITAFLTVACVAIGAARVATGHAYRGVPFGIAPIIIATTLKMANSPAVGLALAGREAVRQKANGPLPASVHRG